MTAEHYLLTLALREPPTRSNYQTFQYPHSTTSDGFELSTLLNLLAMAEPMKCGIHREGNQVSVIEINVRFGGQTRTSSLGAARPLPPSADIDPEAVRWSSCAILLRPNPSSTRYSGDLCDRRVGFWQIAAPDVCDGTSAVGESDIAFQAGGRCAYNSRSFSADSVALPGKVTLSSVSHAQRIRRACVRPRQRIRMSFAIVRWR